MRTAIFCFILAFGAIADLQAQLKADFAADQTIGCGVLQVKFQNLSTGPVSSYQWSLGLNASSALPNPSKIYVIPGRYQICLTVGDVQGNKNTICKDDFIKLYTSYEADFTVRDSFICAGSQGSFTDRTISPNGKIVSWIWDVGGSSGVVQQSQPGIVFSEYANGGKYNITLNTKDEVGCVSNVTKPLLQVIEKPIIKIDAGSGVLCDTVGSLLIKNLSPNLPELTYSWDFGNGQTFVGFAPPAVLYSGKGKYDITVSALNLATNCSDTVTFTGAVSVDNLATFSIDKLELCQGNSISLQPNSTINADSHLWNFGDGTTSTLARPLHTYNSPGCYTISHNIIHMGCTAVSQSTSCVIVRALPTVDYTVDKTQGCSFPLKIATTNLSAGGIAWNWTANGNIISNVQQPVLEFNQEGQFLLGLSVTNQFGCTATRTKETITAYRVKPIISSDSVRVCAPVLTPFEHRSFSLDPITKVKWILFTTVPKIINTATGNLFISDTGQFTVRLIIENSLGCADSTDFPGWIQTGVKPVSAMDLPVTLCYGTPLEGFDRSSSFANGYSWTLNNKPPNFLTKDVVFDYDEIQTYQVTHVAYHNGCAGDPVLGDVQIIGAKAAFQPIMECDRPYNRLFLNTSEGQDSVTWDFGVPNDTIDKSTVMSPTFTYKARGDYPVVLTAYHLASNCADTAYINIPVREVKADFDMSALKGCTPFNLTLTNRSQDALSFSYNFPDADQKSTNGENPTIRFSNGGKSTGTLIASDASGCSDTAFADTIDLYQVNAIAEPARKLFCQDSLLTLSNRSITVNDNIIKSSWSFASQLIKDVPNITLKLDSLTTRVIILTVESAGGCIASDTLLLNPNHIRAVLNVDTIVCTLDSARFNATLSGRYTDIRWEFGDGDSSSILQASHLYQRDGRYDIRLTVVDDSSGCSQILDFAQFITVGFPKADFDFEGAMVNCRPFIGSFVNTSQMANRFIWDLGDQSIRSTEINPSHLYTQRGYFDITLIASSTARCADTLKLDSLVFVDAPSIQYVTDTSSTVCSPKPVSFLTTLQSAFSVLLEYGDGSQDSLSRQEGNFQFEHTYTQSGIFYPVIVVTDSNSCSEYAILDTLHIHTAAPVLKILDTLICGSLGMIRLLDSSIVSSPILSRQLRIIGNNVDTTFQSVPASVLINQAGKYSLEYNITTAFCSDSISYVDRVELSPAPQANFTISQTSYCAGDSIILINRSLASSVLIDSIRWSINTKSGSLDTFGLVLSEGISDATLIVKTEVGCKDTAILTLNVKPSVFSTLSHDTTICAGSLLTLSAKLSNPVPNTMYRWKSSTQILCEGCLDHTLRPNTTTRYTFETEHPNGCIRPLDIVVQATRNNIDLLKVTPDTVICQGDIIPLAVDVIDDVFAYQWDRSRKGLSCYENCKNPIAKPDSTTTYIVSARNGQGCERLDSVRIAVRPQSVLDLGLDRTICSGDSFSIQVNDIRSPTWTGASGISCSNCANPIFRPLANSVYVLKGLKNNCPVSDSVKIFILSKDLISGGKDTTICIGSPVSLQASATGVLTWSPALYLNDPKSPTPIAQPSGSITYHLAVQNDLCMASDSIRINVLQSTIITGQDRTVCPNDEFTLSVEGEANSFLWSGPDILAGQNTKSIDIKPRTSTTYQVIARNKTCTPDTVMIKVNVIEFIQLQDSITYSAIPDLPVRLNKGLKSGKEFNYSWFPSTNLSCVNCVDPVFVGSVDSRYQFELMDPASGCSLVQIVKVNIVESCEAKDFFTVPNIFTPNQDGINDALFIIPKAADQFNSFRIFDRSGDLVFESSDVSIGWDGTFRQSPAPMGVYVYLLQAECPQTGEQIFLKGDITLVR